MITGDRRSQIDGRKESCFHIIADDRERSQSRVQCSAEVSKLQALCADLKIASKQHGAASVEEEILAQANLFLLLHLRRRHRPLKNRENIGFGLAKFS